MTTIAVGLEKPEFLQEHVIFVTLSYSKQQDIGARVIEAHAQGIDNFEYNHPTRVINSGKDAYNIYNEGTEKKPKYHITPYHEFINELVKLNNGVLNIQKIVQEGVNAYEALLNIGQSVEDWKKDII